jgi:hypothetical protein
LEDELYHNGLDDMGFDLDHAAAAVLAALNLTEETRTLADGMGGLSTNWKTGETTSHFRPCTRQRRWVSAWVGEQP